MWPFLGSLIGAGSSLLGGLMGAGNSSDQFWASIKANRRGRKQQMKQYKKSMQFARTQYKFGKQMTLEALKRSGLKWRMQEAKKAGIHPLYALGGTGGGFSPSVSVGTPGPGGASGGVSGTGDGGLASGIAQAGQHLGRAVDAMATHDQRNEARLVSALSIENQGLQNELLRSQIRRIDSQTGPALPAPGQKYLIDGQGNVIGRVNTDAVTFSQRWPESKQNIQLGSINQANPYVSNAEDVEARYGELADMLWGGVTIPADIYWNYLRNRGSYSSDDMYGSGAVGIGP